MIIKHGRADQQAGDLANWYSFITHAFFLAKFALYRQLTALLPFSNTHSLSLLSFCSFKLILSLKSYESACKARTGALSGSGNAVGSNNKQLSRQTTVVIRLS